MTVKATAAHARDRCQPSRNQARLLASLMFEGMSDRFLDDSLARCCCWASIVAPDNRASVLPSIRAFDAGLDFAHILEWNPPAERFGATGFPIYGTVVSSLIALVSPRFSG